MANEASGGVIIGAAIAFAAFAWRAGEPLAPTVECSEMSTVQYVSIPEPAPLVKTPDLWWPLEERQRAAEDEAHPEKIVASDNEEPEPRRHWRRHWRRR